jgi:hypothetical protein
MDLRPKNDKRLLMICISILEKAASSLLSPLVGCCCYFHEQAFSYAPCCKKGYSCLVSWVVGIVIALDCST